MISTFITALALCTLVAQAETHRNESSSSQTGRALSDIQSFDQILEKAKEPTRLTNMDEISEMSKRFKDACLKGHISGPEYVKLNNPLKLQLLKLAYEEELKNMEARKFAEAQRGSWVEKAHKDLIEELKDTQKTITQAQALYENGKTSEQPFRSIFDVSYFVGKSVEVQGNATLSAKGRSQGKQSFKGKKVGKKAGGHEEPDWAERSKKALDFLLNEDLGMSAVEHEEEMKKVLERVFRHSTSALSFDAGKVHSAVEKLLASDLLCVETDRDKTDIIKDVFALKKDARAIFDEDAVKAYEGFQETDIDPLAKLGAFLSVPKDATPFQKGAMEVAKKGVIARLAGMKDLSEDERKRLIEQQIGLVGGARLSIGLGSSAGKEEQAYMEASTSERRERLEEAQTRALSMLSEFRSKESAQGIPLNTRETKLGVAKNSGKSETPDLSHLYNEPKKQWGAECAACATVAGLEYAINKERSNPKTSEPYRPVERLSREYAYSLLKAKESGEIYNTLVPERDRKALMESWRDEGTDPNLIDVLKTHGIPPERAFPVGRDDFLPKDMNAIPERVYAIGKGEYFESSRGPLVRNYGQEHLVKLLEGGHHPVMAIRTDARRSSLGQIEYLPEVGSMGHMINVIRYIPEARSRLTGERLLHGQFEVLDTLEGKPNVYRVDAHELTRLSGAYYLIRGGKTLDKPVTYPKRD